jgi:protein involved in polysaccharide export with SLBB domain
MQKFSDQDKTRNQKRMKLTRLLVLSIISWSLVAAAQQQGLKLASANEKPATARSGMAGSEWSPALTGERRPLYRLHMSDVVDVSFTFAPEFNQSLTVQPDGFVTLKDVPETYVEGMTLPQFEEAVKLAYAGILHEPEVSVVLKNFDKPYFIASGEVSHPGKYELRGDTTVMEALAIAGGLTGQAKHSQVILFRRVANGLTESRVLNVKHMQNARDLTEDLHLKAGDLLFVPQNRISKLRRYLPASSLSTYVNPTQF